MNKPLLTIILPVYNVEQYIKDCLLSIPSSCADQIEIILVDDCSKDKSIQAIEEFYKEHTEFEYTIVKLPENKGAGNARNTGIKLAKGKYFIAIDSDDYFCPGAVESILERLQTIDSDVIIGNLIILKDGVATRDSYKFNEAEFNSLPHSKALDHLADNFNVSISKHIFKTSLIVDNKLFIPDFYSHQDDAWIPFVMITAKSISYIDVNIFIYRIREGSITTSFSRKKDFCKLDIAQNLYALAEKTEHKKMKRLFYHKANMLYRRALRDLHRHTDKDRNDIIAKADSMSYILNKPDKFGNTIKYGLVKIMGIERYTKFNNSIKLKK
jgi:glycosyltransferase involved in cell wall biosynthesis